MNLKRNFYKKPFSMKRTECSEDRIDKIERNLIESINNNIKNTRIVVKKINLIIDQFKTI